MQMSTQQPARHPAPTVKALRLAFLIFERPDLDRATRFLVDFGLQVWLRTDDLLLLRGTTAAPYCYRIRRASKPRFVGMGFEVASLVDLQALAATVPGAPAIEPIDDP